MANRIFAEQRESNRRITVGDRGVREHARIDLAPADRLGGRRAGQSAPDDRVGRDLDEIVVAALEDAVDLPQRRLPLQVEILRRAAAKDHATVFLSGANDGAHFVDVLVGIDLQRAAVDQLVIGDVHADRAVAGGRGVDRHAAFRRCRHHRILRTTGAHLQQVPAQGLMQLRRRYRAFHAARHQEVANERVGIEQHLRRKQHVVDANHALVVENAIVDERRAAAQREVQRIVQIVIQIGARADHEIDQPAFHQLDDAAAQAGGGQRAGDGQRDGRVVLLRQHLVAINAACLAEPRGIECLEALVDQGAHGGAALRTVVLDRFAFEKRLGAFRRARRPIRHRSKRNRFALNWSRRTARATGLR